MLRRVSAFLALGACAAAASAQCVTFGPFVTRGAIPGNLLPPLTASEVSGMAASRHNPGILWIHDDGGAGGPQADGRSLWAISEGVGALVENAAPTFPAGVPVQHAFGTGLAGVAGAPGLAATRAPRLGGPGITLDGWQAAPGAAAVLVFSLTGYPDGVVPFAGGWLHAAPDAILVAAKTVGGTAAFPLGALPDDPLLRGLVVSAQLLVDDPTAPHGISLSAGLRLVLDR